MFSSAETMRSAVAHRATGATGPVIVATDGRPECASALSVGRAIARRVGADVEVVAVYPPAAPFVPDAPLPGDEALASRLRDELSGRVRRQCEPLAGESDLHASHIDVRQGEPATTIARVADERAAQIIVLGLGRHDVIERVLGDETALKMARCAHVPVLAVPEAEPETMRSAIVGIDFSEPSLRAAAAVLWLLRDGGMLRLVHVIPKTRTILDEVIPDDEQERYLRHRFLRFVGRLTIPPGVAVSQVTLHGDVARELLRYAADKGAGFVALGSHGHGSVQRFIVGSVTTRVLRGAHCAVLVVPPAARYRAEGRLPANGVTMNFNATRWAEALDSFTRSNVGCRTRLEIDDPELGAQSQEQDYRLLGVAFDPHDQCVEIMLGELGGGEPHLSRSIAGVESVHILSDNGGRDLALRLRHGAAQTILTLIR